MDLHRVAHGSGLVGGLCWLVRYVVSPGGTGGAATVLYVAGLVLLGLALVASGAGLVKSSAAWLQVIVGLALPLLVWSVLEVLHPAGNPRAIDAALGLAMAVVGAVGLARSRSGAGGDGGAERRRSAGAHAR